MPDYVWRPIDPLGDAERGIDLASMRPLYENWRVSRKTIQTTSPTHLAEFNKRLIRRLSVETGILERLYDLVRGTTEALVTYGFAEDLVTRSNTNIEPSRLIDLLRDQEAAIELIMDCIARNRDLTKGLIPELHAMITRHQDTTTTVDQFGKRLEIPLLKGKFKEQPNNPRRPDGISHEYCPPIHVESEMDQLLAWLHQYSSEDPVIVAAWFHHRFTRIHHYQDGNGRVSRALTTMVVLRAGLLPLVIDRDLRVEYLEALESADLGDLRLLATMFARLERNAILQALSVDSDVEIAHQQSLTSAVISSLQDKFGKRRLQRSFDLRKVNDVAIGLRSLSESALRHALEEIEPIVSDFGNTDLFVQQGGTDFGNAHWYKSDVIASAREAGATGARSIPIFANFSEGHYFVKASIRADRERLVFVISFHHVGRDLTGIMEAVAFSRLESYEDAEDRESVAERFSVCSVEPFVFTHQTDPSAIVDAFSHWLDASLAIAVKEYGDRL
jgi:hypothetical protein